LQELSEADFDPSLTGFDPDEIDGLLAVPDEEKANEAPPLLAVATSRLGDLWICGKHRVLCGGGDLWVPHQLHQRRRGRDARAREFSGVP
jgi:hypothetical protein